MNKALILCISTFLLIYSISSAQVGINTTEPKSSLDIVASDSSDPSPADGILIPRIDAFPTIDPGIDQNGMLVFLNVDLTTNQNGFYYWDATLAEWIYLSEEWNSGVNSDSENLIFAKRAKTNGVDVTISEEGKFGIGTDNPEETVEIKKMGDNDLQITSVSPPNAPNLIFYTTGGTDFSNRDFLLDNAPIGYVTAKAWSGTSKSSDVANISILSDGDHSTGSLPTKMIFSVTEENDASDGVSGAQLSIRSNGNIGMGTDNPDPNAQLELSASNRGLLLNRVSLIETSDPSPLSAHEEGMFVYNTNTNGSGTTAVSPGMYYNTGINWEKLVPESTAPKVIGKELLLTTDGTFTVGSGNFIWTSANATSPSFDTAASVLAPFGSTTSHITVIPAATSTESDAFVCDKNIISLRVYTTIQVSTSSTGRWRTNLYLNNVFAQSFWGSPPSNRSNQRTQGVFEYGPITAGTEISISIDDSQLPSSTQNQRTYFVIEYEN